MAIRYGEPEDVPNNCNARLSIGDNFGDNHATMVCQLDPLHEGPHQEKYKSNSAGQVVITWEKDERDAENYNGYSVPFENSDG